MAMKPKPPPDDIDKDLDHLEKMTEGEPEDVRRRKLHDLILEREAQAQARGLYIRKEVEKED